jgi:DNA topoisomerase VI subunit B
MSDEDDTYSEFSDAVNMTAKQIERWLDTDESREVGQKKGGSKESTGHEMGRRIVTLLNTNKGDLSEDDYAAMRKVVGYVKRHRAQRPEGDVTETPWRYSLMN